MTDRETFNALRRISKEEMEQITQQANVALRTGTGYWWVSANTELMNKGWEWKIDPEDKRFLIPEQVDNFDD
jgi:hypothetical protein